MYKILKMRDKIRVSPAKFSKSLEDAVQESLEEHWEGIIEKGIGVVLSVVSVENIGEGKILPGDGAIHYPLDFKILTYCPEMYEVVKGVVIDVTEFGAFIRIGPLDGMIHVSQIMNDFVSYDAKNSIFSGRESKRLLKEGDVVIARIVSVSLGRKQYKIGLTTRQVGLGVLSWLEKGKKEGKIRRRAGPGRKPARTQRREKK